MGYFDGNKIQISLIDKPLKRVKLHLPIFLAVTSTIFTVVISIIYFVNNIIAKT